MRIRVDDAAQLSELIRHLHGRVDLITERANDTEAEVSVLGSFADGGRAELEAHLERWREANPGATVVIVGAVRLQPRVADAC
jgi:hypothetical protein